MPARRRSHRAHGIGTVGAAQYWHHMIRKPMPKTEANGMAVASNSYFIGSPCGISNGIPDIFICFKHNPKNYRPRMRALKLPFLHTNPQR